MNAQFKTPETVSTLTSTPNEKFSFINKKTVTRVAIAAAAIAALAVVYALVNGSSSDEDDAEYDEIED
jgi:hypothetical protein